MTRAQLATDAVKAAEAALSAEGAKLHIWSQPKVQAFMAELKNVDMLSLFR
jgi:hypothetical protein